MSFNASLYANKFEVSKQSYLFSSDSLSHFKYKGKIRPALALDLQVPLSPIFGLIVSTNLDWLAFSYQFKYQDSRNTIIQDYNVNSIQLQIPISFYFKIKKKLQLGLGFGYCTQFNVNAKSKLQYQSQDNVLYESGFAFDQLKNTFSIAELRFEYQLNKESSIVLKINNAKVLGNSEQYFKVNAGNMLAPAYAYHVGETFNGGIRGTSLKLGYKHSLWYRHKTRTNPTKPHIPDPGEI